MSVFQLSHNSRNKWQLGLSLQALVYQPLTKLPLLPYLQKCNLPGCHDNPKSWRPLRTERLASVCCCGCVTLAKSFSFSEPHSPPPRLHLQGWRPVTEAVKAVDTAGVSPQRMVVRVVKVGRRCLGCTCALLPHPPSSVPET